MHNNYVDVKTFLFVYLETIASRTAVSYLTPYHILPIRYISPISHLKKKKKKKNLSFAPIPSAAWLKFLSVYVCIFFFF